MFLFCRLFVCNQFSCYILDVMSSYCLNHTWSKSYAFIIYLSYSHSLEHSRFLTCVSVILFFSTNHYKTISHTITYCYILFLYDTFRKLGKKMNKKNYLYEANKIWNNHLPISNLQNYFKFCFSTLICSLSRYYRF